MYIVGHLVSVKTATMKSIFPSNQEHLQLYKLSFAMAQLEFFSPVECSTLVAYHPGSATVKRAEVSRVEVSKRPRALQVQHS